MTAELLTWIIWPVYTCMCMHVACAHIHVRDAYVYYYVGLNVPMRPIGMYKLDTVQYRINVARRVWQRIGALFKPHLMNRLGNKRVASQYGGDLSQSVQLQVVNVRL